MGKPLGKAYNDMVSMLEDSCNNIDKLVLLWHKTQMGPMKECLKAQEKFSEIMWKLWDNLDEEEEGLF